MAVILALLLGGKVVVIATAARVNKFIAESLLAVVVPARCVLITVARLWGPEALIRFRFWARFLIYACNATRRAVLFGIEAIIVAPAATIVELLAATQSRIIVPLEHILSAIAHRCWLITQIS